jgi:hypothetical protein
MILIVIIKLLTKSQIQLEKIKINPKIKMIKIK